MSGVGNYSRQRLQDLQSQDEQGCQCRWCSGRAAVISVSHSVSSLKSDQTKQRKTEDRIPTALVTSIRNLTFPQKIVNIRPRSRWNLTRITLRSIKKSSQYEKPPFLRLNGWLKGAGSKVEISSLNLHSAGIYSSTIYWFLNVWVMLPVYPHKQDRLSRLA